MKNVLYPQGLDESDNIVMMDKICSCVYLPATSKYIIDHPDFSEPIFTKNSIG